MLIHEIVTISTRNPIFIRVDLFHSLLKGTCLIPPMLSHSLGQVVTKELKELGFLMKTV